MKTMDLISVLLFLHVCIVASTLHQDGWKRPFRQRKSVNNRNFEEFSKFLEMLEIPQRENRIVNSRVSYIESTDQDYISPEDTVSEILVPRNIDSHQFTDEKLNPEIAIVNSLDRAPFQYFDVDGSLTESVESVHPPFSTYEQDDGFTETYSPEAKLLDEAGNGNKLVENIFPENVLIENYLPEEIPTDNNRISDNFVENVNPIEPNLRVITNEELISLNVALLSKKNSLPRAPEDYLTLDRQILSDIGIGKTNEKLESDDEHQILYEPYIINAIPLLASDDRVPNSPEEENPFSKLQGSYKLGKGEEVLTQAKDSVLGYAAGLSSALAGRIVVSPVLQNFSVTVSEREEDAHSSLPVKTGWKEPSSKSKELNENVVQRRGTRAVNSKGMPNGCHSQHLHKCGSNVIKKFNMDPSGPLKCKIREEFLDCMVQQREIGCYMSEEYPISPDDTNSIRSQIKNILWSAHGCLLF